MFSKLDRLIQKIPGLKRYYARNYGLIRHCFHKLNQRLKLTGTPIYVHWLTTYDCNFTCKHCEANAGEKRVELLTTEQISGAVRDMGDLGVKTFIVTGGEPLLREDIFEIISLAQEQGIKNICLATNGYLVDRFKEQLTQAKLARAYISIDGVESTSDKFRGVKGAFYKAMEALDFFKKVGVKEREVNTIVHQENIEELEELKKNLLDSSATLWNLQIAVPVGRAKNLPYMHLSPHQVRYLFDFVNKTRQIFNTQIAEPAGYLGMRDNKLRSGSFFCGAGIETCSIMPDGEVLGCHVVYDNAYSEGNIKKKSLKSIWKEKSGRFRQPELDNSCKECEYLHACRGGCWGMRLGEGHCLKEIWY